MSKSYDSICCFRGSDNSTDKRLLWEITTACNLSCGFCHRTSEIILGPSISQINEVVPLLKRIGIKEIIISGGEPFLRTDIFDILSLLKKEGFSVDLCTNGTLITNEIAIKLSKVLNEISVSIDSFIPAKHDLLREQSGAWKATVLGIQELIKNNLSVHSISIVNKSTISYINLTVEFLYELGVSSIAFIGNIPIGTGNNYLTSDDNQKKLKKIFKNLRNSFPNISINTKELIKDSTMNSCMAGEIIYGLDVNMIFKPCILHGKAGGIDLKIKKNLTIDVISKLKEIKRKVIDNSGIGQGFCPGSCLLNATQNEIE